MCLEAAKQMGFLSELRIRIHLIRIRIQHLRLNTDPDPDPIGSRGIDDQKSKKYYSWKKNKFFLSKTTICLSLGLHTGRPVQVTKEGLQLSKENIQQFKTWNFLNFFLLLWIIFALLDPDPDPQPRLNPDPIGIRIRNPAFYWKCQGMQNYYPDERCVKIKLIQVVPSLFHIHDCSKNKHLSSVIGQYTYASIWCI